MLTIHHLNNSRSQRVLWLLEELGIDYAIARYQRDSDTNLAPPELLAVHPLGKSPVLTDGDMTVIESGAENHLVGVHSPDPERSPQDDHRQYCHGQEYMP